MQFLHVQCVRLAAGRRTQAGDATDQWRAINETLRQFAPLNDDRLL